MANDPLADSSETPKSLALKLGTAPREQAFRATVVGLSIKNKDWSQTFLKSTFAMKNGKKIQLPHATVYNLGRSRMHRKDRRVSPCVVLVKYE